MNVQTAVTCLLLASTAAQAGEPQRRSLLDGRVSMLVPADFAPMPKALIARKYPAGSAPNYVLTNHDATVNIAYDIKPLDVRPNQMNELLASLRQQMTYGTIRSSGIRRLNGYDYVIMEFDVTVGGDDIRNVMAMSSLGGKLLAVSYNCMLTRDAGCGVLGKRLIESIELTAGQ